MVKHRRRSFAKKTKLKFSSNRWERKHLLNQGNICKLCGEPILNMKEATIDHIIPLSKGGTDTLDNMQIAHDACNREKGNEYDEENNNSL